MRKDTILFLIAIAAIWGYALPKPINMVVSIIILVPVAIYLSVDIIKNGNAWEKDNF